MSSNVAERLIEHLERCGFVVMKRPPIEGSAPPYQAGGNQIVHGVRPCVHLHDRIAPSA
jgi:hypothetical protein